MNAIAGCFGRFFTSLASINVILLGQVVGECFKLNFKVEISCEGDLESNFLFLKKICPPS